jgi:hypothetical protein
MDPEPSTSHSAMGGVMMVCCLGFALLFLVIPLIGWPLGIAIVAAVAVAMLFFHQPLHAPRPSLN